MDNRSRETLQRVEDNNDSTLKTLLIGRAYMGLDTPGGVFYSTDGDDFSIDLVIISEGIPI